MTRAHSPAIRIGGGPFLAAALIFSAPRLAASSPQVIFTDQTDAAGLTFSYFPINEYPTQVMFTVSGGGAVGDFNRDGWQDLLVMAGGAGSDKLFINNGDGTFTDRAAEWGVDFVHKGMGVAVGDFNRDGWLDLYVLSYGPPGGNSQVRHILYMNIDGTSFLNVATTAGVNQISPAPNGTSAAFGDYDLDGDLDLYTCAWTFPSEGNRLFRNNGDGTFSDVTVESGLGDYISINGFSPAFIDMDGDRYPELLVAADLGSSQYFINNRDGTFTVFTDEAGVGLDQFGMGHAVGDFNADGRPDWYVSSVFNPEQGVLATGQKLYMNQGNHHFIEGAVAAGVQSGGWGWGNVAVDLDHDGRQDIIEVNGFPTLQFLNQSARVFKNNGDGTFTDIAAESGFNHTDQGRAVVNFDYDNDGDQDIVVFTFQGNLRLFRNDTLNIDPWLKIFFDTSGRPDLAPDGFGVLVYVRTGLREQWRWLTGHSNYLSVSELSVHFGLGDATIIDELRVEWPNGADTVLTNVPMNQTLTIAPEGAAGGADLNGDGVVNGADLAILLAQWGGSGSADLNGDRVINGADLAILLAQWG